MTKMTMSDEVRAEYDEMLSRVVWKRGSVVSERPSIYGWMDYEATSHIRRCLMASHGTPVEDSWSEFAGTFAESDHYRHGITVPDVTCECGKVSGRSVRMTDAVSDVAEAVFTEMYDAYHRGEIADAS